MGAERGRQRTGPESHHFPLYEGHPAGGFTTPSLQSLEEEHSERKEGYANAGGFVCRASVLAPGQGCGLNLLLARSGPLKEIRLAPT